MKFEWDETKRLSNLEKHGIDFRDVEGFAFSHVLLRFINRDGELRRRAVSFLGNHIHVMVYVLRDGTLRVISLRRANRREAIRYLAAKDHPADG